MRFQSNCAATYRVHEACLFVRRRHSDCVQVQRGLTYADVCVEALGTPSDMLSMTLRPPYASALLVSARHGLAVKAARIHLRPLRRGGAARWRAAGLHTQGS